MPAVKDLETGMVFILKQEPDGALTPSSAKLAQVTVQRNRDHAARQAAASKTEKGPTIFGS